MTQKEKLKALCDEIKVKESGFLVIYVENPDMPEPEMIINSVKNVEYKKNYFDTAYNDELELKAKKEIKIVNFLYLGSL